MKKPLTRAELFEYLRLNDACSEGMARAELSRAKTARGVWMSTHVLGADLWFLAHCCCLMGASYTTRAATARKRWPWADVEARVRVALAAGRKATPVRRYAAMDDAIRSAFGAS